MKTGAGLALIGIGAILAFAVTANTSVFNLHTAGWVIMIIGVIGIIMPGRTYGWIGSRLVRRTRTYRGGGVVEDTAVRPYMTYNPGTSARRPGLPRGAEPVVEPADETQVIEDIYEA
jgi:hypothetical protein